MLSCLQPRPIGVNLLEKKRLFTSEEADCLPVDGSWGETQVWPFSSDWEGRGANYPLGLKQVFWGFCTLLSEFIKWGIELTPQFWCFGDHGFLHKSLESCRPSPVPKTNVGWNVCIWFQGVEWLQLNNTWTRLFSRLQQSFYKASCKILSTLCEWAAVNCLAGLPSVSFIVCSFTL